MIARTNARRDIEDFDNCNKYPHEHSSDNTV